MRNGNCASLSIKLCYFTDASVLSRESKITAKSLTNTVSIEHNCLAPFIEKPLFPMHKPELTFLRQTIL